jgi:hypothetical protein
VNKYAFKIRFQNLKKSVIIAVLYGLEKVFNNADHAVRATRSIGESHKKLG